jgi:hypothetical protein
LYRSTADRDVAGAFIERRVDGAGGNAPLGQGP